MHASSSSAAATSTRRPTAGKPAPTRAPASAASTSNGVEGAVTRRLQSELMGIMASKDRHATAFPDGDNLFKWIGTLKGSDDTAFAQLTYKLEITFPSNYPFEPPKIVFTTPMFHPNVDNMGNICLDILKDKWSASLSVSAVLQSLRSLLGDPNNESPLNGLAANMWADQVAFRNEVIRVHGSKRSA